MKSRNMLKANVLRDTWPRSSCGIYNGTPCSIWIMRGFRADTDANFVMTGDGRIIEGAGHGGENALSRRTSFSI